MLRRDCALLNLQLDVGFSRRANQQRIRRESAADSQVLQCTRRDGARLAGTAQHCPGGYPAPLAYVYLAARGSIKKIPQARWTCEVSGCTLGHDERNGRLLDHAPEAVLFHLQSSVAFSGRSGCSDFPHMFAGVRFTKPALGSTAAPRDSLQTLGTFALCCTNQRPARLGRWVRQWCCYRSRSNSHELACRRERNLRNG